MGRRSTRVAWVLLAIYAAGISFTAALAIPNGSVARDPTGLLYQLDFTAFMVVGALIVARRPGNAKERVIANPSGTVGCPILSRAPS